jgi:hypothetical protein
MYVRTYVGVACLSMVLRRNKDSFSWTKQKRRFFSTCWTFWVKVESAPSIRLCIDVSE